MASLDELLTDQSWDGLNPVVSQGLNSALALTKSMGLSPIVTETVRPDSEQPEGGDPESLHYARNGARAADLTWNGLQWGDPNFNAVADHLENQGFNVIRTPHGTGPHIHFETQDAQNAPGGNLMDQALFSTVEASPAKSTTLDSLLNASPAPSSPTTLDSLLSGQPQGVPLDQFQSTPLEQQSDKTTQEPPITTREDYRDAGTLDRYSTRTGEILPKLWEQIKEAVPAWAENLQKNLNAQAAAEGAPIANGTYEEPGSSQTPEMQVANTKLMQESVGPAAMYGALIPGVNAVAGPVAAVFIANEILQRTLANPDATVTIAGKEIPMPVAKAAFDTFGIGNIYDMLTNNRLLTENLVTDPLGTINTLLPVVLLGKAGVSKALRSGKTIAEAGRESGETTGTEVPSPERASLNIPEDVVPEPVAAPVPVGEPAPVEAPAPLEVPTPIGAPVPLGPMLSVESRPLEMQVDPNTGIGSLKPAEPVPVPTAEPVTPEVPVKTSEAPSLETIPSETRPEVPQATSLLTAPSAITQEEQVPVPTKADNFLKEKAIEIGDGISEAAIGVKQLLAPASKTEQAGQAAGIVRENLAEMAQKADQAESSLHLARIYFDRQPAASNIDFINRVEKNLPQVDPQLDGFAKLMRETLDSRVDEVHALGTGKLQNVIENYFPHIWKDPEAAKVVFGDAKRPLEGSKSFLKKRVLEYTSDGIERGLEPVSYNPVDLTLIKSREMDKYIMAHKTLNEFESKGLAELVKPTERQPNGFVKINDNIATVYGPPFVKVKEAFDKRVFDGLQQVATDMGVDHQRMSNVFRGTGAEFRNGVWGFSERNAPEIRTRFGGPESVVAHEIGHQIDRKFDLQKKFLRDSDISRELTNLADLRDPDGKPAFMDYVQKPEEKMALVTEAYVHAPDVMKEVAPKTYDAFDSFVKSTPELSKLADVKPSLELGSRVEKIPTGGINIRGRYWAPEPVAEIINNYLSPGLRNSKYVGKFFRGYLGVANAMNMAQLGFSAFHLGFTSMDSIVSRMALGIVKMSHGDVGSGLKAIVHSATPGANLSIPIENMMKGNKLLQEWYKPGSQGAEMGKIVDALVAGGGRVRMDKFYHSGIADRIDRVLEASKASNPIIRQAFRAISSKTILEDVVPRQKLGIFLDLARYEIERNPNMTHEQMRNAMAKIWNSIENRMGQLTYDNLFWNNVLKDVTMASVRSVGWNLGTFREIGGGTYDTGKALADIARGKSPEITYRMSYVAALPIVTGIMGGLIQYMYTGKGPQEIKDLYFPQTGLLDANGKPQRISLPSYMKDIVHYAVKGPIQTVLAKLTPALAASAEFLNNKDYYGTKIYNEGDPWYKIVLDTAKFAGQTMVPFSVRGAKVQADLGGNVLSKVLPFVGVTPAPAYINQSPAERAASDILASKIPPAARTQAQAEKTEAKRAIRYDIQTGVNTGALADARAKKIVTDAEVENLRKTSKENPLTHAVESTDVSWEEAVQIYSKGNATEKQAMRQAVNKKLGEAITKASVAERPLIIEARSKLFQ
jgi:hypothetical protein